MSSREVPVFMQYDDFTPHFAKKYFGKMLSFILWFSSRFLLRKQHALTTAYLWEVTVQTLFVKRPEQLQTPLNNYFSVKSSARKCKPNYFPDNVWNTKVLRTVETLHANTAADKESKPRAKGLETPAETAP